MVFIRVLSVTLQQKEVNQLLNALRCRSFRITDKSRENSNIIEVESDVKIYYNQLIITRKFKLERI